MMKSFIPDQYWSDGDLPQVESTVSEMTEHLDKTVAGSDVHGGKSYTDQSINSVRTSFGSAYANMNQRVVYNDQRIRALELGLTTHAETIATLELSNLGLTESVDSLRRRVVVLEQGGNTGSDGGIKSYTQVIPDASTTWIVEHGFGTKNLVCQIYDENYNPVLPSGMEAVDEDNWAIFFDVDQAGRAVLIST